MTLQTQTGQVTPGYAIFMKMLIYLSVGEHFSTLRFLTYVRCILRKSKSLHALKKYGLCDENCPIGPWQAFYDVWTQCECFCQHAQQLLYEVCELFNQYIGMHVVHNKNLYIL